MARDKSVAASEEMTGYGRGPLLAMGAMAVAVAGFGGAAAVAMVLDEDLKTDAEQSAGTEGSNERSEAAADPSESASPDVQKSEGAEDSASGSSGDDSVPSDEKGDSSQQGSEGVEEQAPEILSNEVRVVPGPGGVSITDGDGDQIAWVPADGSAPEVDEAYAGQGGQNSSVAKDAETMRGSMYQIVWGDTLSEIAVDHDVSLERLAEVNMVKDPDLIYAGDGLVIPTQ